MRLLTIFALLLLLPVAARSDDEPVVQGIKKSEWIKMLDEPSVRKRRAAVLALGVIGPLHKDVVPALGKALRDKEPSVRQESMNVLGAFEKDQIRELVPDFADLLKEEPQADIRRQAATLLGRIGGLAKPAINRLTLTLGDKENSVRIASAEALGRIGPDAKEACPAFTALLKDKDPGIRTAGVFALGRIGTENAEQLDLLIKLFLADESVDVRREASRSVGLLEIDPKKALPFFLKSLETDPSPDVRQQSALALGKIGAEVGNSKDAVLKALNNDKDRGVRVYLVRSLSSALGEKLIDLVPDLLKRLKEDPEGEVRLAIVQEIGNLGPSAKAAAPALNIAQQDVQIAVREAAKVALKRVTTPVEEKKE